MIESPLKGQGLQGGQDLPDQGHEVEGQDQGIETDTQGIEGRLTDGIDQGQEIEEGHLTEEIGQEGQETDQEIDLGVTGQDRQDTLGQTDRVDQGQSLEDPGQSHTGQGQNQEVALHHLLALVQGHLDVQGHSQIPSTFCSILKYKQKFLNNYLDLKTLRNKFYFKL